MTLYKGDVGDLIELNANSLTIAASDIITLYVRKPNGYTTTWSLVSPDAVNRTTGVVSYYAKTGDINQAGEYIVIIKSLSSTGAVTYLNTVRFVALDVFGTSTVLDAEEDDLTYLYEHGSEHLSNGSDPVPVATTSVAGLESAADKTKLDTIESGADVTDATNVAAAGAAMVGHTHTEILRLSAGGGILPDDAPDLDAWETIQLSNGMNYIAMKYGKVNADRFQFKFSLPQWDGGTITFTPICLTHGAGTVGHTFKLNIAAVRVPDSGDMNVALQALTTCTDAFVATDYQQIMPPSAAVTPAGTGYGLCVEVTRDWATDTYIGEVHLIELLVTYTKTG